MGASEPNRPKARDERSRPPPRTRPGRAPECPWGVHPKASPTSRLARLRGRGPQGRPQNQQLGAGGRRVGWTLPESHGASPRNARQGRGCRVPGPGAALRHPPSPQSRSADKGAMLLKKIIFENYQGSSAPRLHEAQRGTWPSPGHTGHGGPLAPICPHPETPPQM